MGINEIRRMKEQAENPPPKQAYRIPKVSKKRQEKIAKEKEEGGEREQKEKWFAKVRKKLTGVCGCGCGRESQKNSDNYFRHSCCHIFPKRDFKSVQFHPLNYVERAFWGGCHTNMDDGSIEDWPSFKDWHLIVERFHVLAPELTDEERANKFYTNLERIIYANPIK